MCWERSEYFDRKRDEEMRAELEERRNLILKSVRWATRATEAIQLAGGSASLLDKFPDDLIFTMVSNGLQVKSTR